MKRMKRALSLILALMMAIGMLPLSVFAEEETIINPNYVMYQASRYSDNFQTIFGDTSSSYANIYFTSMREDAKLMGAISAWEAIHIATEPSYSLKSGLITKRDMYKLV